MRVPELGEIDFYTFQSVIPLSKQVDYFQEYKSRLADHLGTAKARAVAADAVYAISIGTNDFVENYFAFTMARFLEFTVGEYTDFLIGLARNFMAELDGLDACTVAFTGLGAMGCLPIEHGRHLMLCIEEYNAAVRAFNSKPRAMVDELAGELLWECFRLAKVYNFFTGILQDVSRYGFVKVATGCCSMGLYEMGYTCSEWDVLTCPEAGPRAPDGGARRGHGRVDAWAGGEAGRRLARSAAARRHPHAGGAQPRRRGGWAGCRATRTRTEVRLRPSGGVGRWRCEYSQWR